MAQLNFNALIPQGGPQGFYQGFEQGREKQVTSEINQMKLEELKRDRDEMLQLQEKLKGLGQDPDVSKFLDTLAQTGKPEYVKMAIEGKQKIKDLDAYAKIGAIEPVTPVGAAPAMPTGAPALGAPALRMPQAPAPRNMLGTGTFGMEPGTPVAPAMPAPVNAMAPAPAAAAPVNALAQPTAQVAQAQQRIEQLVNFARSNPRMAKQAMDEAKFLQDQLEFASKRGPAKPAALQELEAYMSMSPEQKTAFEKLQKIKAPSVTATATSTPVGKSLAEPVGKLAEASLAKAEGAAGMMENANMIRDALNTGNVIAGPLAGPRTKFAQVLAAAGAGDREKLQNTLSVTKGLAGLTLESRGELKGQGQVTDTETKLLERARSGDTDLTLDELQQVVNISQRLSKRLWENHQNLLKKMETDPSAASSINYYRPLGQLSQPIGVGKSAAEKTKESTRPPLTSIFGQPAPAR